MLTAYNTLKTELKSELINILEYWSNNTLDHEYGGFVGKINHKNQIIAKASKGIILNSRILWSFSAASSHLQTQKHLDICDRAFNYLKNFFNDTKHKGVYWELDYKGKPTNKRKQAYAQAFTIYGLSEYYILTKNKEAKAWAIEIFELLETHAKDTEQLGYFEAFDNDWSPIQDMRLSNKDMNASKTMNTHLHILEAYTSLLKIHNHDLVKNALKTLIELFFDKFLNNKNHYHLFFDNNWNLLSNSISYGHDIEAAWLIIEAAKALNNDTLLSQANIIAVTVANTFLKEGIDDDGSVLNEKSLTTGHVDTDRHWWAQMEALIGLKYAYELQSDPKYLKASIRIWNYTKTHLIDHKQGEWFFRVSKNGYIYTQEDKVSMWKAPYHSSRACIILTR
jgi:mannobiose 2-epimerase